MYLEEDAVKKKDEDLLNTKDVAWILDCSPDDVSELARKGKLKSEKVGRFWKYHEADVIAYKSRNRESA
jgi:excisionase family DNA binding protein